MKKGRFLVGIVAATGLMFAGCSSSGAANDGKETITLWSSGSDNVKNTYELLAKAFNESDYGDDYVLNVEFISSGTGAQSIKDRVIAAQKAGQTDTDYDIIEVADAEFAAYMQEGGEDVFLEIDHSLLTNKDELQATTAIGEDVLVPYRGTTVVLAYDSEKVPEPPQTAEALYEWINENPGRFAYNSPGTGGAGGSFVMTAVYNQLPEDALHSEDPSWKEEWQAGFDLLEDLHPYLYQTGGSTVYPNKNQGTLDLLANKEIDMTPAWVDQIVNQKESGILPQSIEMVQVDPAFTGNLATLAIPTIGSHPEGAHAVIDFIISEEAQTILLDEMGAFPVIDSSLIDSENSETMAQFDISQFRTSSIGTLNADLIQTWDETIAPLK